MTRISLRELKEKTPSIVREVEEESAVYNITLDSEAIAVLEPADSQVDSASLAAFRERRKALIDLIDEFWTSDLTSTELLAIERREE